MMSLIAVARVFRTIENQSISRGGECITVSRLLPIHQNVVPTPTRTTTPSSTIRAASSIQAIAGTKSAMTNPSMQTSHAGMCTPATNVPRFSARWVATTDSWLQGTRANALPGSRSGGSALFYRAHSANRSKYTRRRSRAQEVPNSLSSVVS